MATGGQESESEEEVELVVELSNLESHSESFTDDTFYTKSVQWYSN